jgi:Cu(I)/Ag(I) efflux system membrane fusion protein
MSSHGSPGRAGADAAPRTPWQKFRLVVKVVELRLRFVALMAVTGLVFAYWDTLWNRYEKWTRPTGEQHTTTAGIEYYCPMHPQVVQEQPGACPICGMPLAKRKKGEKPALPAGVTARVELLPFRVQQAGIKVAEVAYAPLTQSLTTVGYVDFDERQITNIVSKVPGKSRVEKLYVSFTGQDVEAGEPLAELYSPELSQAIAELLSAARLAGAVSVRTQSAAGRSLLGDRRELVRLSSEKLKHWGITQAQIDDILKKGTTEVTIPILSPTSGHVFKKNVVRGDEVDEKFIMFEVADLHTVWVRAQVYENQAGLLRLGQPVEAVVEAFPGETFAGKVEFIQPHLDPATRTVEAWYAIENPGHRLRPGMFAKVTLSTPVADLPEFKRLGLSKPAANRAPRLASLTAEEQKICPVTTAKLGSMGEPVPLVVEGRGVWTCCAACPPKLKAEPAKYLARLAPPPGDQVLSVPESAVIDTGNRKIVYVESGPGVFDGRVVVLGPRVGDRFPVFEGLAPGEKVAAAGAFLIDAESRINPGTAPAASGADNPPGSTAEDPGRTRAAAAAPAASVHRH